MAATGYTPISLYYSTTASAVPTAGNLANGELALNIADMKLYAKNSAGTVTLLASNASTTGVDSLSFGSTGLTPSTATTGAITVAGTLNVANGGTGLTSLTAGYIPFGNGTSALSSSANLFWDSANARLGIGTSSPSAKLHVSGGRTLAITGNESYSLGIGRESNTNAYYLGVHSTTNPNLLFSNNAGTTNMTLDYSGILGLNVTPSAWQATDFRAIQIGSGGSAVYGGNGAGYSPIGILSNGYISGGSVATTYSTNGQSAGRYSIQGNNHYWAVAPAGSGTISWTTAMTLDSSSNLTATGSITAYSDERLKKDWSELPSNFVERLALVKSGTYTRIDNAERQAGSSAQDWQNLLPEVVLTGADEAKTLSLAYGNAALVSAIELAKRLVALESKFDDYVATH